MSGGLTHPADASLGDPLFAARKEGELQLFLLSFVFRPPMPPPLSERERGVGGSKTLRAIFTLFTHPDIYRKCTCGLTHPADASLGDPLFAARKEGELQLFLLSFVFLPPMPPPLSEKERGVGGSKLCERYSRFLLTPAFIANALAGRLTPPTLRWATLSSLRAKRVSCNYSFYLLFSARQCLPLSLKKRGGWGGSRLCERYSRHPFHFQHHKELVLLRNLFAQ